MQELKKGKQGAAKQEPANVLTSNVSWFLL